MEEKSNSNFYALIGRMKYINRWGLMRSSISENIEGHSFQVSVIAHALAVIGNQFFNGTYNAEKIALYGLYHDASEIITGDMPTPVKYYNPEIKQAYQQVEEISKRRLLGMLPAELQSVYEEILFFEEKDKACYSIVKAADRISAYIKCIEELNAGNSEFADAANTIRESIVALKLPEADYFMAHCINGFRLTLDQLTGEE